MVILEKVAATFAFAFGIIFLYLPGGFGLLHFKEGKSRMAGLAGTILWVVFMLVHVLAIYRIWFVGDSVLSWVVALGVGQVLFFSTIARDVSTR
jgi:hypothetical protein